MLRCSLKDLIKIQLDYAALDKLQWKDFGIGETVVLVIWPRGVKILE